MIPPGFVAHCGYCGWPLQSGIGFNTCTCGSTPAGATSVPMLPVSPTAPQAGRYMLRGGYEVCVVCGLVKQYCRGHAPADPPAPDGAESDLSRRIAEARAKVGGR